MRGVKNFVLLVSLLVVINSVTGCAYLKHRGNDAMDMFDVGITVTETPQFAMLVDLGKVIPLGYSNIDGKLYGIGRSTFGAHDFRQKGGGYLIGGAYNRGLDNYDVDDLDDPETYEVGLIGFMNQATIYHDDPSADEIGRPKTRPTCPKTFHLGWVGVELGCKVWDVLDFFLGWTTLDIGEDDIDEIEIYDESVSTDVEEPLELTSSMY